MTAATITTVFSGYELQYYLFFGQVKRQWFDTKLRAGLLCFGIIASVIIGAGNHCKEASGSGAVPA